jgi:hypothetical protein
MKVYTKTERKDHSPFAEPESQKITPELKATEPLMNSTHT